MSIPLPNLDDRRFQDLVDDAKRLVQRRCPEWTDHNVSDPGVTLIEAFATMVDQLLYRLNRVPDRNYLRFLDLIGIRRFPPVAAQVPVSFWLSTVQAETVVVKAGTQVATPIDELDRAVVFETTAELALMACAVSRLATESSGQAVADRTRAMVEQTPFDCFGSPVTPGDAFYVGLSSAAPSCVVAVRIDCRVEGIGVDPTDPPLRWEGWTDAGWEPCVIERDDTGALNRAGDVVLHLPAAHTVSVVSGQRAGWLRCVLREPTDGQPFYSSSPRIHGVSGGTIGGTVQAAHAELVRNEALEPSDGSPGQRFQLSRTPVPLGSEPEILEIGTDDGWQRWSLVSDFADSGPADRHFCLDRNSGEVALGPALRRPDGSLDQRGAVPAKGAAVRISVYRTGGGRAGNVRARALSVLRTPIPYITSVENRIPASGGVDGEDLSSACARGALSLRTRSRAVTAEDYEVLAREAAPGLSRIRCVAGDEGVARLLVVPRADPDSEGRLDFADLRPDPEVVDRVAEYLDARRTIGTRLVVEPPFYRGVTVVARLTATRHVAPRRVRSAALRALFEFLNPLTGGAAGTGWSFGRDVVAGDLHALLQRVEGAETVDDVRLFNADPVAGTRGDTHVQRIELGRTELAWSFEHQVLVQ